MINARTETRTNCFGKTFTVYTLTSTNHNKVVEVKRDSFYKNWDAKNLNNSSRFTKDSYKDVLDHLTSKGW